MADTTTREGALVAPRILPDGRELTIYAYLYNDRVCIGPPGSIFYDEAWCFVRDTAIGAVAEWDGTGDPPGPWIKAVHTGQPGPGMELL